MRDTDKKVQTPKFRGPFYILGDALNGLLEAAKHHEDSELRNLIDDLEYAKDKIREHLNENYRWD